MTKIAMKQAESTFRILGFNKCILSNCICVHGNAYKNHPETGNCLTCNIPNIMKDEAREYLLARRKERF